MLFLLRFKHIPGAYVRIRNSAVESSRRPRHGQPTRGDRRPAPITSARHRTDPRHQRRMASLTRPGRLSGPPPAHTTANLSGESQIPADHEAMGRGGAEGSEEATRQQSGRRGHRRDARRTASPADGGVDQHDGADLFADAADAADDRYSDAVIATVVGYQRGK